MMSTQSQTQNKMWLRCLMQSNFYSPSQVEDLVVGSFILDRTSFHQNIGLLNLDYFFNPIAKIMIQKMISSDAKSSCEFSTEVISDQSPDGQMLTAYMTSLKSKPLFGDSPKTLISMMANNAKLSVLRGSASNILGMVDNLDHDGAVSALMATQIKIENMEPETIFDIKSYVQEVIEDQNSILNNDFTTLGLSTEFKNLDPFVKLKKQELVIVAARPSIGKTAIALNIANNLCSLGGRGMIFSAEMSTKSLLARLVFLNADLRLNAFSDSPTQTDMMMFQESAKEINDYDLHIDDKSRPNIDQILIKAKSRHNKKPLDWVMIDYAQILTTTDKKDPVERIGEITSKCKALAKDIDAPVILLAQLNRGAEEGEPSLASLKGSASLEEDADIVIMLHRDRNLAINASDPSAPLGTKIIIAKNRSGMVGATMLSFTGNKTKFDDMSSIDQQYIREMEDQTKKESKSSWKK